MVEIGGIVFRTSLYCNSQQFPQKTIINNFHVNETYVACRYLKPSGQNSQCLPAFRCHFTRLPKDFLQCISYRLTLHLHNPVSPKISCYRKGTGLEVRRGGPALLLGLRDLGQVLPHGLSCLSY